MSTIRRYPDDFKKDAVQYVEDHLDVSLQQAAEYLGMPKDTLYGWIKAHRRKLSDGDAAPTGNLTETDNVICLESKSLRITARPLNPLFSQYNARCKSCPAG